MKLRSIVPAALMAGLLVGCSPDGVSPGGGSSPTPDAAEGTAPTEAVTPNESPPAETENPADRYDY